MVKLLVIALGGYLLVLAIIFSAQTSLLFPARMVGPAPPIPAGGERLQLKAKTGERLHGVRIEPAARSPGRTSALLVFPGNAWNAEDAASYLHNLYPGREIFAFHYRGYAPSEGAPSAAALAEDSLLVHDFVSERLQGRPIVAIGFSIGSGVAARLAAQRKLAGVILVTPFDSLAKVAAGHYRWLPAALLLRHRLDPGADLENSPVPVALIAAERDTLIPPARSRALAGKVRNLAYDRTVAGSGHNDIYQHPAFTAAMHEALTRIED